MGGEIQGIGCGVSSTNPESESLICSDTGLSFQKHWYLNPFLVPNLLYSNCFDMKFNCLFLSQIELRILSELIWSENLVHCPITLVDAFQEFDVNLLSVQ